MAKATDIVIESTETAAPISKKTVDSEDSSADTPFKGVEATSNSGLTLESSPSTKLLPIDRQRRLALDKFLAAPRDTQRQIVETKWAQLCYELVERAQRFSHNVESKDFGKLSNS